MDPQLQQALARVLDEMVKAAEAIGVQGVRLWPQLVGITFVKNLAWAVFIPIVWIVIGVLVLRIFKWLRAYDEALPIASADKGFLTFIAVISIIAWILLVFITFGLFATHVAGVFYPEAATVLDLLSKAGAAVKK